MHLVIGLKACWAYASDGGTCELTISLSSRGCNAEKMHL